MNKKEFKEALKELRYEYMEEQFRAGMILLGIAFVVCLILGFIFGF